jgi:excisionase family DNA binding protein
VDHRIPPIPTRHPSHDGADHSDRLLRPAEVVELLGVSQSWLYLAASQNRIPHIRLGGPDGPLRFHRTDVTNWIAACRRAWQPGDTLLATSVRAAQLPDDLPAA